MTDSIADFEEKVHSAARGILTNAAEKLNREIRLSDTLAQVYTIENETKLEKEDYSGSNLSVVTTFVDNGYLSGGFTTGQTTRTFKTKAGLGYIDSEILLTISRDSVDSESVNLVGIEKAIKVLTEGYLRSLHVLYQPDKLEV